MIAIALLLAAPAQGMTNRQAHKEMWQWYRNSGAKCVHSYEGSWSDPNPLYWGGFQMSLWFQDHYAPWRYHRQGTADHWSPYWQTVVTHRVVTGRNRFFVKVRKAAGWGQWPNTAAACGLL